MVLLFVVIIGISIFCFAQGYIVMGFICLIGLSYKIGFAALIITAIYLYSKGHWIVGSIPLLLIVWNILGTTVFKPKSRILETDMLEDKSHSSH